MHNLENEENLLNVFGYTLVGPNSFNCWQIVDDKKHEVGHIQYGLIGSEEESYGYKMEFNTPKIDCKSTRSAYDLNGNPIEYSSTHFDIHIKRKNGDIDYVSMTIGDFPKINLWSNQYGFMSFNVDAEGLYLNFRSETENYNVEEVIAYQNTKDYKHKEYTYQLRYCKNNRELSSESPVGSVTREISGVQENAYDGKLNVTERTLVHGILRREKESTVKGTLEEMVILHQMGIDAFEHFRYLINKALSTKEDIIPVVVSEKIIVERGLGALFLGGIDEFIEDPIAI